MKTKILTIFMILAVMFAFLPAGTASAADLCVNTTGDGGCYTSIQAAITATPEGGVINVAAGTYDEENITISKGLTLQGAGAALTFIAPSIVTNNSTIVVNNPTGDVLIDGFSFNMQPKVSYGSAVVVTGTAIPLDSATVTISNNVVNGSNDGSKSDYGFYGQGNNAKLIIANNVINKTGDNPICMEQQHGSTTVSNNVISITDNVDYNPYFSMTYGGVIVNTPQIVQGNTIYLDHGGTGWSEAITFVSAANGNWANDPADIGGYSDVQILNNTIYGGGERARGIGIFDNSHADGQGTISNLEIIGNSFIGENSTDPTTIGIYMYGDVENALIENNSIDGVLTGIQLKMGLKNTVYPSGTEINLNKITNTGTALLWEGSDILDASPNWWGSTGGPTSISGNVDYIPWCGDAACSFMVASAGPGFSIQSAIDALPAEGGVVYVPAGTYTENVIVNKPVEIIGPSTEVAKVVGAAGSNKVFEITASHVTIKNLYITLAAVAANYDGLINLPKPAVSISDINILNNTIYVAQQTGAMSTWWAQAIHFDRDVINSTVSGNKLYNTRSGLVVGYNSSVTITDNVIYNTKGGIMNYTGSVADADARVISGNSWNNVHNEWDVVWNSGGGPYVMDMDKFVLQLSKVNNDAYVVSQMPPAYTTPPTLLYGNRSHVFVNATTGTTTLKNDNGNINVPYAKIQDGIDAVVSGGTVYVAAGTYVESLNIVDKDITLVAPDGATVESPVDIPVDFTTSAANSAVVYLNNTTSTIDGFTIDGAGHGNANYRFYGVAFYNAAGTVQNCTVKNIQDTPFSGAQHGNAIYAWNGDSAARTINVLNNKVFDYQKNGITMNGAGLSAIVSGNTVTGKGTTAITAQNGIQFGWGSSGTITNNTVIGNSYHKDSDLTTNWGATGILLYESSAVELSGNTISDNSQNLNIYNPSAAVTLGANTFASLTGPLTYSYHVSNDSSFSVDLSQSTMDGVVFSTTTPQQILPFAGLVWDGIDDGDSGVANLKDGYQFVDPEGIIQSAVNHATAGDTILVASGTYDEDVNINKTVTLTGSGATTTTIRGIIGGAQTATVKIAASNVIIEGFTITRLGNNLTDWNNTGLNLAGIAIQGAFSGAEIQNNTLLGNRTAIDINNSSGHTIQNNVISDNRTGMIFRNQTDNLIVTNNQVTNNWTVGILFLDASSGTNVPVQTALNSNFSGNNLSGNWYGQVVERQTGGLLPLPGTTNLKNFPNNWWGTANPVVSTANSIEPGYAALIPVAYGGTAVAPEGQPDILGEASANIIYNPRYDSAAMTTKTYRVCAGQPYTTIQSAVNTATAGDTVEVCPAIYAESVNVDKGINIYLEDGVIVQGASPCFNINASYTYLTTESTGGAKCVPAGGANGINVASSLVNIVIAGLDIDGTGQATGAGIAFNGAVTDIQVVDNYIHDLDGSALVFSGEVTNNQGIQGNLFQNVADPIISTATALNAEWNAWGAYAGAGTIANVDADPWTHVDLYVESSGYAPVGTTVTYTVYGNLISVMGAEFTLQYPTAVLDLVGAPTDLSDFVAAGPNMFVVDEVAGTINFNGIVPGFTPLTGEDLPIFSATFNVIAAESGTVDLVELTDVYSMFPNSGGPSTNIYAAALVDGFASGKSFSVTGTVSMQGRTYRGGVPASLAGQYYSFNALSTNILSKNLVFGSVADDTYVFSTNQPRYLNVPAAMGKTVTVSTGNLTFVSSLQLLGGNAVWTDNIINPLDAAVVGGKYKIGNINDDADVNFDNKVDILDLTLLGGNYHLTSDTYASWTP